MERINRRRFIGLSAGLAAGGLGGALLAPHARAVGANGDIRLGVIGVGSTVKIGGKGKQDIRKFSQFPGVRVVALCDVDQAILDAEATEFKKRNEAVATYSDLRKLLDSKDVDAVIVTTPNHWHALATVWACQAGKDVYVQKPASHNIFEGRQMVRAARKYKRIVQCPSASRSPKGFQEALAYVREGHLGKVRWVYGLNYKPRVSIGKVAGPQPIPKSVDYDLWSGPAPKAPLTRKYLHYDWHWDWRYGNGDLGNMGIHFMDGCRMAAGADRLPRRAMCIGGRFGYDDDGLTPNTQIVYYDYQPAPIVFEVRGLPKDKAAQAGDWRVSMDSYRGMKLGVMVFCEGGYLAADKVFDNAGKLIRRFEPTTPDLGANFIEAVRSRRAEDLLADICEGHLSAGLVHMGNISHRLGKAAKAGEITERIGGRKDLADCYERVEAHLAANGVDLSRTPVTLGPMLTMDPAAERFVGEFGPQANRLVGRPYRKPFVVPENV